MILYNFATRSRPQKMLNTYNSVMKHSKGIFCIKIDTDDAITLNSPQYAEIALKSNVAIKLGTSTSKIHAINRDISIDGWDVLVNISDDMVFHTDHDIEADFKGNYDQAIHYPDGHVNNLLMTMSVIGKDYYNRFGYVYHPSYVSLWCDNEAQDVAQALNRYQYINKHFFTHHHPAWTKEQRDDLGKQCDRWYRADEKMYLHRKALKFPK